MVELNTGASDGRAQADALAAFCRDRWPRLLESLLQRFDDPARVISVDKLEVTVTLNPGDDLAEALETHLRHALPEALERALGRAGTTVGPFSETVLHWLMYFLKNGRLPWSAPSDLRPAELEYLVSEALPGKRETLEDLAALLRRPEALRRLLRQFSPAMPRRIAEVLWALKNGSTPFPQRIFPKNPAPEAAFPAWEAFFAERQNLTTDKPNPPEPDRPEDSQSQTSAEAKPSEADGFYLQNAGLVLLGPFLPALLKALHCLDEDGKTVRQPGKALAALHEACWGRPAVAEWELVLPKILCGMEPEQDVDFRETLTEAEREEIHALLQAVVGHWSALGNSSPDALRESFLQRDGKLHRKHDRWELNVEQRAIDILLDAVPWSFSLVKLPWMHSPLLTQWT
jgi:hypothetical protein